jgi:type II secretory pathway pseudopilin PulG
MYAVQRHGSSAGANPVFTTCFLVRKRWAETSMEQIWSILRAQSGRQRGSGRLWGVVENNGGLRTGSCGEEGNAHSPPDIHYSKEPTAKSRGYRLTDSRVVS